MRCRTAAPRDPAPAAQLARRPGARPGWWRRCGAGLLLGALADAVGNGQRVNLLAPPVWGRGAWNLSSTPCACCCARRAGAAGPRLGLRALLVAGQASGAPPPCRPFSPAWLNRRHRCALARRAPPCCCTCRAAALAVGLAAGLYLRGLVLDFRAGWQSTFLDAARVHAVLSWLLAPAAAVTGIAVPDVAAVQALRVAPEDAAPASAAPWIHLYAATLGAPRACRRGPLLAVWAAARARAERVAARLPLVEPYFQRLLREQRGGAVLQVLPHGAAPSPQRWPACARAGARAAAAACGCTTAAHRLRQRRDRGRAAAASDAARRAGGPGRHARGRHPRPAAADAAPRQRHDAAAAAGRRDRVPHPLRRHPRRTAPSAARPGSNGRGPAAGWSASTWPARPGGGRGARPRCRPRCARTPTPPTADTFT